MRKELKKYTGQRLRFTATVEKYGSKRNWNGFPEETILFKEVKFLETGQLATDHIWFTVGKTIKESNLSVGDRVQFDARVKPYVKGYVNYNVFVDERRADLKLSNPAKFLKIPDDND